MSGWTLGSNPGQPENQPQGDNTRPNLCILVSSMTEAVTNLITHQAGQAAAAAPQPPANSLPPPVNTPAINLALPASG